MSTFARDLMRNACWCCMVFRISATVKVDDIHQNHSDSGAYAAFGIAVRSVLICRYYAPGRDGLRQMRVKGVLGNVSCRVLWRE